MARAADTPAGEIARGRGGFYRSTTGTPYVTDPTGALVGTGPRKGLPKRLPYGAPSSRGKQIENTYNLSKWSERRVVMGIGADLALIADCAVIARMDPESQDFKDAADRIVLRAKDAAEAGLAAERGTHAHALSEDHDEDRDWILRAEAGEDLGVGTDIQRSLVTAWHDMLERDGLEILAVEASCVDDTWRLAGTLDRIARTTKPLRFALVTGEIVEIPVDTVLVLDVKSGKHRTRPDGSVLYWQAYAVQIAAYAQSVPYDTELEQRDAWPWEISQTHALIAHLDVLGAIDGNPSCQLVYVDLAAGREHGGATVVQARAWEDRRDVFSVAQIASTAPDSTCDAPGEVVTGTAPIDTALPGNEGSATPATTDPGPAGETPHSPATIAPQANQPEPPQPAPGVAPATVIDEGPPADPAAVTALKSRHSKLAKMCRLALGELAAQAMSGHHNGQGRCPFYLTSDVGKPTVRRFEIYRGLITLGEHDTANDDTIRAIVTSISGPADPAMSLGVIVGSMSHEQAAVFALRCDQLVAGDAGIRFDPDGTPQLVLPLTATAA